MARRGPLLTAAVAAVACVAAARGQEPSFRASLDSALEIYGPITEANTELLKQGRVAESTKALLDAVPEKERTAAHCFVLANTLFKIDFAVSYELHRRAAELLPDEPMVALEWAIERHRKGEHAEAEPLYAKAIAAYGDKDRKLHALRADCLLRLGRHAEAVAEWKAADVHDLHSEIETAFAWVYGAPHPVVKRGALLEQARAGDVAAIEELIELDLRFETDWWNAPTKREYLEVDLVLAREQLAKEPARLQALELLAKWTPGDDLEDALGGESGDVKDELEALKRRLRGLESGGDGAAGKPADAKQADLAADLTALGVLGAQPTLPANSRIAGDLLQRALDRGVATPSALLASFESEYRRRIAAGDAKALDSLCSLYEETKAADALAQLEQLGWEKWKDRDCAAGLLSRAARTLASGDPLLVEAVAKFPEDERITAVAGAVAVREKKDELAAVVRLLEAQLQHAVSVLPANATFKRLEALLPAAAK